MLFGHGSQTLTGLITYRSSENILQCTIHADLLPELLALSVVIVDVLPFPSVISLSVSYTVWIIGRQKAYTQHTGCTNHTHHQMVNFFTCSTKVTSFDSNSSEITQQKYYVLFASTGPVSTNTNWKQSLGRFQSFWPCRLHPPHTSAQSKSNIHDIGWLGGLVVERRTSVS